MLQEFSCIVIPLDWTLLVWGERPDFYCFVRVGNLNRTEGRLNLQTKLRTQDSVFFSDGVQRLLASGINECRGGCAGVQ